jgi:tripartite-type tricarboxylate transporter receptor subunit TctC
MKVTHLIAASIAGLLCSVGNAWSQNYPVKPVRVIVPFPPGGANDIVARIVFPKISEKLGQTFVIDNRSGAGGTVGTAVVTQSKPDGYTFLIQTVASHVSNAHLYRKLPYDALNDVTAVAPLARLVGVLSVHPSLPVKSVKELVALAKSRPHEVRFGHAGAGSFIHLNAVLFESMTNIPITLVPFKGGGPTVVGLITGEVQAMVAGIGDIIEHVKAKRARLIGVTSTERIALLPDVPPVADTVPGFEATTWVSMFAPAGTPKPIIDRLNGELGEVLRDPSVASRLRGLTYDAAHAGPEVLTQRVKDDHAKIGKVFGKIGLKLD